MSAETGNTPLGDEASVPTTKDVAATAAVSEETVVEAPPPEVSEPVGVSSPTKDSADAIKTTPVKEGDKPTAGDASDKKSPTTGSDGSPGKSPGKRNTSQRVVAALADPTSLLHVDEIDAVTKQTQCTIPYQRSTFLLVGGPDKKPTTKNAYRNEVWNDMESNNYAAFPRPVFRRIPNFKESALACNTVAELDQFQNAQTILIGPDRPQQHIRLLALQAGKTLLVPTSRVATGFLNKIVPPEDMSKEQLSACAAAEGMKKYGEPVELADKVKIDLVIMGSVVLSKAGRRLGKGEGFADLEWAMMRSMDFVDNDTVVITCVHDSQVKDELPESLFEPYDLPVDIIVTATQTIPVREPLSKPDRIIWSKLTAEKLEKVPVLKALREIEEKAGKDVTLGETVKRDIISRIEADNLTEKCCQTFGVQRRRLRSTTNNNRTRSRDGQARNQVQGEKNQAKVNSTKREQQQRKERRRGKSTGDDEGALTGEENGGAGDIVKKVKPRRNRVRQRNLKSKSSDKENDGADTEKSGADGEEAVGEDGERVPKPRKRRERRGERGEQKSVEAGRGDAAEERQSGGGGRRGGGGGVGGRGGRRNDNFSGPPPQRFAPPWLHPYNAPPPPHRYGGFYPPPPPANGGRFYRNQQQPDEYFEDQGFWPGQQGQGGQGGRGGQGGQGRGAQPPGAFYPTRQPAVFVGDISKDCGEDMFADVLEDRKVRPVRLIWQHDDCRSFLVFDSLPAARDCVRKLRNLSINDEPCRVDLSNMTKRTYFQ